METATTTNYKVGDKVTVVANKSRHYFPIGENVTVTRVMDNDDYTELICKSGNGAKWSLYSSDVEPVESENDLQVLDTDLYERMYDQGENPNIAQAPASNEATVNIRIVPKKRGLVVFVGVDEYAVGTSVEDLNTVIMAGLHEAQCDLMDKLCCDNPESVNITARIVVNPA